MTTPRLRIVFFGTPDFAEASLRALAASEHEVVGVVTAPDRKAGRGQQLQPSRVKEAALGTRPAHHPARKIAYSGVSRPASGVEWRPVRRRGLSHAAGNGLGHAAPRHGQCPRQPAPRFPGGCAHPACHRGRCGPHGGHVLLHHPRHRYRQPAPATFHARDAGRHGGFRLCTADGRRRRPARRHRRCPRGSPPRRAAGPIDAR